MGEKNQGEYQGIIKQMYQADNNQDIDIAGLWFDADAATINVQTFHNAMFNSAKAGAEYAASLYNYDPTDQDLTTEQLKSIDDYLKNITRFKSTHLPIYLLQLSPKKLDRPYQALQDSLKKTFGEIQSHCTNSVAGDNMPHLIVKKN